MLVAGKWTDDSQSIQTKDPKGGFVRPTSAFRNWVTPNGEPGPTGRGGFAPEAGRYRLFVSLSCPWASRTVIARKFKKLEEVLPVSVVEPAQTKQGWRLCGDGAADHDVGGDDERYLHAFYSRADPNFTGRATVPVLWDTSANTIVNNESAEIVRMLNSGFGALADNSIDLYHEALRSEIDRRNERIYARLNNGVYRAGFATSQRAYGEAFGGVFGMLDELEFHLATRRLLVGERVTEADIRLFVTLIRFDPVYLSLFKCNLRRLSDYEALSAYVRRLLDIPAFHESVDMDHIKRGYYSITALNPNGIVPLGPDLPALGFPAEGVAPILPGVVQTAPTKGTSTRQE